MHVTTAAGPGRIASGACLVCGEGPAPWPGYFAMAAEYPVPPSTTWFSASATSTMVTA